MHSIMGVASFVLPAVGVLLFVVASLAVDYITRKDALLGPPGFEDPGFELLVLLLLLMTAFCNLLALGLGVTSLLTRCKGLFGYLGVMCSGVVVGVACALYLS